MLPEEWTCDWHDHAVRRSESRLVGECLRKPLFVVSAGRWLDFLFSIRRSRRRSTEKSAEEGTLFSRGRLSKQIDAVLRHKDRKCNEDFLRFLVHVHDGPFRRGPDFFPPILTQFGRG